MKAKAVIALPQLIDNAIVSSLKSELFNTYSDVDLEYIVDDQIDMPRAVSFDRNGADIGTIDRDPDLPSIGAINLAINSSDIIQAAAA